MYGLLLMWRREGKKWLLGQQLLSSKIRMNPDRQCVQCAIAHEALRPYPDAPQQKAARSEDCSSANGGHALRRLPQVVAIQNGINLQVAIGYILEAIRRSFRDGAILWPLLNRAARVTDRTRDSGSVAIVISHHIALSHSAEGTAC
jgi:hypothetical protein